MESTYWQSSEPSGIVMPDCIDPNVLVKEAAELLEDPSVSELGDNDMLAADLSPVSTFTEESMLVQAGSDSLNAAIKQPLHDLMLANPSASGFRGPWAQGPVADADLLSARGIRLPTDSANRTRTLSQARQNLPTDISPGRHAQTPQVECQLNHSHVTLVVAPAIKVCGRPFDFKSPRMVSCSNYQ
jgi:hypothetical protein